MKRKTGFVGWAAALLLFVVFLLLFLQIICRYFGIEAAWTEELIRWLWIWSVCLGFIEVERQNEHVNMNYFLAKLHKKAQLTLLFCFDLLTLVLFLALAWLSVLSFMINWDTQASMLPFSRSFLYLSLLVASVFIVYEAAKKMLEKWRLLKSTSSPAGF